MQQIFHAQSSTPPPFCFKQIRHGVTFCQRQLNRNSWHVALRSWAGREEMITGGQPHTLCVSRAACEIQSLSLQHTRVSMSSLSPPQTPDLWMVVWTGNRFGFCFKFVGFKTFCICRFLICCNKCCKKNKKIKEINDISIFKKRNVVLLMLSIKD